MLSGRVGAERIAGAPISWGVCEVPGWGCQLGVDTVLGQMRQLGLTATEFGPEGFLPAEPHRRAAALAAEGLRAVGGFVALVLHDPDVDPEPALRRTLAQLVESEATTLVLAAATGRPGYDIRPALDPAGWRHLLTELDRVAAIAATYGVQAVLHPHVGTTVQDGADIGRVLEAATIDLCLDTGHLVAAGVDPVELARTAAPRIAHAHLKDVDGELAVRVRLGELGYTEAVCAGLYRPLGTGIAQIADVVAALESGGYAGWYVLEQDIMLASPGGAVQVQADVQTSLTYLTGLR